MPRKNKNVKHTPHTPANPHGAKTRYQTRSEAERAADYRMLLNPGLDLYVYQSPDDGGWYLTRQKPTEPSS
jgi:hypothetical protein